MVNFEISGSGFCNSIPDSGITNPWQELHIKKGEHGA
jgi:hypothetical protein